MRRSIGRTLLTAVLALAVLGSSCGGDEREAGGAGASVEGQTIEEFLGWDGFDEAAAHQNYLGLRVRIEEMIVECMADRGLRYEAREPPPEDPLLGEGLTDTEAKLRFGYGFFALMLEEARRAGERPEDEGEDPESLWGHLTDDMDAYIAAVNECDAQVEEELGRPDRESVEQALAEAWGPLDPALEAMWESLESDPRLVTAGEDWSNCMADHGYDFTTEEDIEEYLWSKMAEIEEAGGFDALVEGAITEAEIQPLADEELAIAAADLACRTNLDMVHEDLVREYNEDFINEHRDRLERIRPLEQQLMQILSEGWQW